MSAEKMANYEQDMMQEVQRVQELMAKSETGQKMMEASVNMAATDSMSALMSLIGDPKVLEEERMLLAQYMGEMLKRDPMRGMALYAQYLKEVANQPQFAGKRDYYLAVSDAALAVNETTEYQEYIVAYRVFEEDTAPEAADAREATEVMQSKMRKWAEA